MRQITFHEVGMENFGPYIDPMVLTFDNDKLTLITGPNGIGKTMSLEALPFTLYGETTKKAKGDDVINTRTVRNCHTWVKFSIDADNYLVDRYHKYTKLGNTVTVRKNNEDPYVKGQREVLPEIEKLICSKKSFNNTLMFGQKVKDFFTDLVDSDKKEIFRKILDLDIYTTWYKSADLDLKEIKEKLQQLLEQIGVQTGILEDNEVQIAILAKQFKQFETDKKENVTKLKKTIEENVRLLEKWKLDRSKLDVNDEDVENVRTQISDVEKQISHHESEKKTMLLQLTTGAAAKTAEMKDAASTALQKSTDNKRIEFEALVEKHDKWKMEIDGGENEAKQSMTNNQVKISQLETERKMCQKVIDKLNDSLEIQGGECPTCLRDIDEACREHLENEAQSEIARSLSFEKEQKKIEKVQETFMALLEQFSVNRNDQQKQFVDAKKELQRQEDQVKREIQEKLNAAAQKIDQLAKDQGVKIERDYEEYIIGLNKKLDSLQGIKDTLEDTVDKIKEMDAVITNLETNGTGLAAQLKAAEDVEYDKSQLAAYQMRKKELNKAIKEMNKGVVDLKADQKVSEFWKAAWSPTGIPSMLIDESIPFMNEKVSEYLDKLTNGRYLVSFDTLAATKAGEFRDKISVNVLDTHTRANSRIQLSGGQTRIVDIATILTLGDLQSNIQDVNINILLFDEIFDSLDEENIGFVSNILSQLKVGKSIYLISHTQIDQLEADEVLELK